MCCNLTIIKRKPHLVHSPGLVLKLSDLGWVFHSTVIEQNILVTVPRNCDTRTALVRSLPLLLYPPSGPSGHVAMFGCTCCASHDIIHARIIIILLTGYFVACSLIINASVIVQLLRPQALKFSFSERHIYLHVGWGGSQRIKVQTEAV